MQPCELIHFLKVMYCTQWCRQTNYVNSWTCVCSSPTQFPLSRFCLLSNLIWQNAKLTLDISENHRAINDYAKQYIFRGVFLKSYMPTCTHTHAHAHTVFLIGFFNLICPTIQKLNCKFGCIWLFTFLFLKGNKTWKRKILFFVKWIRYGNVSHCHRLIERRHWSRLLVN